MREADIGSAADVGQVPGADIPRNLVPGSALPLKADISVACAKVAAGISGNGKNFAFVHLFTKSGLLRHEGNVRLRPLDFIQRHDRLAG